MDDIFALDVSMGKSYCVWYRDGHCLQEFEMRHTRSNLSLLLKLLHDANNPVMYFEATGIYSRVVERFCENNHLHY